MERKNSTGGALDTKLEQLQQVLSSMQSVVVAFSGGVDSTLVLKIAHETLGDDVVALTTVSPTMPQAEHNELLYIARQIGARHVVLNSQEFSDPLYLANPRERCYYCKRHIYGQLVDYAHQNGYRFVVDGANAEDVNDHLFGFRVAKEKGVRSPLHEVGLTKREVRELAQRFGLPNWDKPSDACLATRIPYGTPITRDLLDQVEQAERVLKEMGLRQVRVRHHGEIARVEVEPDDFPLLLSHREYVVERLRSLGFAFVALDLTGFRSGSMNELAGPSGQAGD